MKKYIICAILFGIVTNYSLPAQQIQNFNQDTENKVMMIQTNQRNNSSNTAVTNAKNLSPQQFYNNPKNPNCDGTQKRIHQNLHSQAAKGSGRKYLNRGKK